MTKNPKMYSRVKAKIKQLRGTVPGVTADELVEDIHAVAVNKYGADQVGALELYLTKPAGDWTLERCKEDALRFKTKTEWQKGSVSAHSAASSNGWIEMCCAHMEFTQRPHGYWTLSLCTEDARRFLTRSEWIKYGTPSYMAARKMGWTDLCCTHMDLKKRSNGFWTMENCLADALKFNSIADWRKNSTAACSAAYAKGWQNVCHAHMERKRNHNNYWTLETCRDSAKRFETRAEWAKENGGAYNAARAYGWLDECCSHMNRQLRPNGYWTFDRCKEDALRFNTRREWMFGSASAYAISGRNGWRDACCAHMPKRAKKVTQ